MSIYIDEKTTVTQIPFPAAILAGDWGGTVIAICSSGCKSRERHEEIVEEEIVKQIHEFNSTHHHTTSLRLDKKELVVAYDCTETYMTLVQFYVRDSY